MHIRAESSGRRRTTVPATAQFIYRAHDLDKAEILARILQAEDRGLTIVFTRTKRHAQQGRRRPRRARLRRRRRCTATWPRSPASRRCARSATARSTCSSPPTSPPAASTSTTSPTSSTTSAPRTRRPTCTASAAPAAPGNTGIAITFVDWDDLHRWKHDQQGPRPAASPSRMETYSSSPHLFPDLDIPAGHQGPAARGRARTREGLEAEAPRGPRRDRQVRLAAAAAVDAAATVAGVVPEAVAVTVAVAATAARAAASGPRTAAVASGPRATGRAGVATGAAPTAASRPAASPRADPPPGLSPKQHAGFHDVRRWTRATAAGPDRGRPTAVRRVRPGSAGRGDGARCR